MIRLIERSQRMRAKSLRPAVRNESNDFIIYIYTYLYVYMSLFVFVGLKILWRIARTVLILAALALRRAHNYFLKVPALTN